MKYPIIPLTLDEVGDLWTVHVEAECRFHPPEPAVRWFRDGSGCPGTAADIWIEALHVAWIEGDTYLIRRSQLQDGGWLADVERAVMAWVQERWEQRYREVTLLKVPISEQML